MHRKIPERLLRDFPISKKASQSFAAAAGKILLRLQAFLSENKMFSDSQKIPERLLRDLSMLCQRMIALINGAAGGASGVIV